MDRVRGIESQIEQLSPEELQSLRAWFAEYDSEQWERQIEADVRAGRLDGAAEQALRDHAEGRSRLL